MNEEMQQIMSGLFDLADKFNQAGLKAGEVLQQMQAEFNANPPPPHLVQQVQGLINRVEVLPEEAGDLRDEANNIRETIQQMFQQNPPK